MELELARLKEEAIQTLEGVTVASELEPFRVKFLGRKGGALTGVMRQLAEVPKEDRPRLGQLANEIKKEVMTLLHEEAMKSFSGGSKAAADFLDAYSKRAG